MKDTVVFYHNDPDGFCAAWAAHCKLGESADYVPFAHEDTIPDLGNRSDFGAVYFLDFCPSRDDLLAIRAANRTVTVLDHHKSAMEMVGGLHLDDLHLVFDPGHAACHIAWEHFHPGEKVPWLVAYVESRDLWRFDLPFSREVNAALYIEPRTFQVWSDLAALGCPPAAMIHDGSVILAYQGILIDRLCESAREASIAGHGVLAVNSPVLQSEVAGRLAKGRPFGACWYADGKGLIHWSLRSTREGLDVSKIAEQYGGGGHARAAGFECHCQMVDL